MRPPNTAGFTLLELLVSLAVVGIITAVAVPQYQAYKQRAFDYRALSDLRNAAVAEEAYYLDHEEYLACAGSACGALPGLLALSKGVELSITTNEQGFIGTSSHPSGSGAVYTWNSSEGGLLN